MELRYTSLHCTLILSAEMHPPRQAAVVTTAFNSPLVDNEEKTLVILLFLTVERDKQKAS